MFENDKRMKYSMEKKKSHVHPPASTFVLNILQQLKILVIS